mgnify:CR=1 FL=1
MLFNCGGCSGIFDQFPSPQPVVPPLHTSNGTVWLVAELSFRPSRFVEPKPAHGLLCKGCVDYLTTQVGQGGHTHVPTPTL